MKDIDNRIPDEILNGVSGGKFSYDDDAQSGGKCPYCTVLLRQVGNHFECPECGTKFDKNGKEINTYDTKRYT